jgi:hydroxyacylglutathione hydrolase
MRVELLPIFENNYVFVIVDDDSQSAVVVDPGEATAAISFLRENHLALSAVFVTHHHADHIDGLSELLAYAENKNGVRPPCYAPRINQNQIKNATHFVNGGDTVKALGRDWQVFALPGHTLGHVAYFEAELKVLFSGDVLFGLGVGRLFEGTPEQLNETLLKLKTLPPPTKIYCTHEYTEDNLIFYEDPETQKHFADLVPFEKMQTYKLNLQKVRRAGKPSVPLTLSVETQTNPFFNTCSVAELAAIRKLRNHFSSAKKKVEI